MLATSDVTALYRLTSFANVIRLPSCFNTLLRIIAIVRVMAVGLSIHYGRPME